MWRLVKPARRWKRVRTFSAKSSSGSSSSGWRMMCFALRRRTDGESSGRRASVRAANSSLSTKTCSPTRFVSSTRSAANLSKRNGSSDQLPGSGRYDSSSPNLPERFAASVGLDNRCVRERVRQNEVTNRFGLFTNPLPEYLIQNFVPKVAQDRVRQEWRFINIEQTAGDLVADTRDLSGESVRVSVGGALNSVHGMTRRIKLQDSLCVQAALPG